MTDEPMQLDRSTLAKVTRTVLERLPAGWRIMPIGALAVADFTADAGQRTKDADYVPFLLVDREHTIPDLASVEALARDLSPKVRTRKDQTAVEALVAVEGGLAKVEFVRGRNDTSGGYFVTRRLLLACANACRVEGRLLRMPPEAIAILKAWAATDQDKLVEAGKDADGFHRKRAAAFRQDVSAVLRPLLDAGGLPNRVVVDSLLAACSVARRQRVHDVLLASGWLRP